MGEIEGAEVDLGKFDGILGKSGVLSGENTVGYWAIVGSSGHGDGGILGSSGHGYGVTVGSS